MVIFFLRRLAISIATIAVASFATFSSLYLAPGDPISFLTGGRPSTPAMRRVLADQYHLNDPFLQRYLDWTGGVLHGSFGESIIRRQPVFELLSNTVGTTTLLVVMAFVIIVLLGVCIGALAALRPGRVDDGVLSLMNISVAFPSFVSAVLLISLFSVHLGWFPVFGSGEGLVGRIYHLVLPAVALAIGWWPVIGETARSAMREELYKEHVETARVRGLPRRVVLRRHVFRNALIPVSTAAGLSFAGLVAGTAIVESAFQVNGIGGLLISSVTSRDFAVVQAIALLLVSLFAVTNLLVDLLYAVLDPRVRLAWSTTS